MTDNLNPSRIMETGMAFWPARILLAAVKLGLFSALGDRRQTGSALGKAIGLHESRTWDFLDGLVALQFLEWEGEGETALYHNTPETALFLDKASPEYLGGILEMAHDRLYVHWSGLVEALRTGQAQAEGKGTGTGTFDSLYADTARLEQFVDAMTSVQRGNFRALAETFDFSRYSELCDVGGAAGTLSLELARRHPRLQCTSFDLPSIEPIARKAIVAAGMVDRVSTRVGDFFTDPLPEADVITMGNILHDWDLPTKRMLIRKAYEALRPGGVFIVIENIIDDERRINAFGLMMSLNMLVETGSGFDYTGRDFMGWCEEAGFRGCEIMPLVGAASAGIAYR